MQAISPFLWFDDEAEQAAELYVSVFPNSRILGVSRYGEGAPQPAGPCKRCSAWASSTSPRYEPRPTGSR